jgi:1-phosphatidylinositol-3-phosphate 5-kinase
MQAAGGLVSGLPEAAESAGRLLHAMESGAPESGTGSSFFAGPWRRASDLAVNNAGDDKSSAERPPSVASIDSDTVAVNTNDTTVTNSGETGALIAEAADAHNAGPSQLALASIISSKQPLPPPLPPKEYDKKSREMTPHQHEQTQSQSTVTNTSITSSLASTVTNAMRYLLNPNDQARPTSPMHHHKLLVVDNVPVEDRPHIKYDWTVGKRLKFTCTVYYARQFDLLRRRCGVDDVLPKSLERSQIWAAEGGKSKSNFWKTSDDRFVIKTLVDAWNVADL